MGLYPVRHSYAYRWSWHTRIIPLLECQCCAKGPPNSKGILRPKKGEEGSIKNKIVYSGNVYPGLQPGMDGRSV